MEGNAYLFKNTLTDTYGCYRSGETLESDGVPLLHMSYPSIEDLVECIKKTEESGNFKTPYFFVSGLPKNKEVFLPEGGKPLFRPASDKEVKEIMDALGRDKYVPNLFLLSYQKHQKQKEPENLESDERIDEIMQILARGDIPYLMVTPNNEEE